MTEQSPRVLVARCENYREDVDAPCTGEIRFRWGMSQSDPCDVCGSRCGVAVAAWERVEPADPSPASPGALAIVRDLVTTLDEFVEEHSDPGTRALGVLSEARRFISTGGTGHVEDSPEVDAIAETINAVVGMSVPFPKLMAAARGVEKLIEARRAGAVPDTGQARALREFADDVERRLPLLREEDPHSDWSRGVVWVLNRMRNATSATSGDPVQAAVAAAQVPESPTDSTPKAGRGGSGDTETATDTTPDLLAWIDTAAETAAAARQARYQETACARRPAEERPDA